MVYCKRPKSNGFSSLPPSSYIERVGPLLDLLRLISTEWSPGRLEGCMGELLFSGLNRFNQGSRFSEESIRLGVFVPGWLLNDLLKAPEKRVGLGNATELKMGHGLKRQAGRRVGNDFVGLCQSGQSRFVLTHAVLGDCKREQVSRLAAFQMTNGLNRAKRQAESHGGMEGLPQNGPTGFVEPAQFLRDLIESSGRQLGRRCLPGDGMEQLRYRVFCQRLVASGRAMGFGDIAGRLPAFF